MPIALLSIYITVQSHLTLPCPYEWDDDDDDDGDDSGAADTENARNTHSITQNQ